MRIRLRTVTIVLFLIATIAKPSPPDAALQALEARMDAAAAQFKAMTAHVTYVNHTDVLNEDNKETGNVVMQKIHAGAVLGRVDFVTPDRRTVSFEARRIRIYTPKIKTVQEIDLGDQGEQVDQFLMIGFGTSGTALAKDYVMKVLGPETVKGQQSVLAIRLELVPKAGKARELIQKLELWIPSEGAPYPLQEKVSQASGDYRLVVYSDLKINPTLQADALELKLPAGVITEHPVK